MNEIRAILSSRQIAGVEARAVFKRGGRRPSVEQTYDCPYSVSYAAGPRCNAVVRDGKVYTLGAEGNLLCLDAQKGE